MSSKAKATSKPQEVKGGSKAGQYVAIALIAILGLVTVGLLAVRGHNIRGNVLEWYKPAYQADLSVSLAGQRIVVTGGNTGIGKEMVTAFLGMGADVIVGCRSLERCNAAYESIKGRVADIAARHNHKAGVFTPRVLDLGSFASVRAFVEELHSVDAQGAKQPLPLHVLVNNAGVFSENSRTTTDGLGEIMGVNHFGVYLLTRLLVPHLLASVSPQFPHPRIVVLSSDLHQQSPPFDFDNIDERGSQHLIKGLAPYSKSKLANIFTARELSRRFEAKQLPIRANAVHPGFIATDLSREATGLVKLLFRFAYAVVAMSSWEGAQNSIHLASSPALENVSGEYFVHFHPQAPTLGDNPDLTQQRLWKESAAITGVPEDL